MALVIGVELGQRTRPSALCVADAERRWNPESREKETHFVIRHLERLVAGTSYPEVGRRLEEVAKGALRHDTGEESLDQDGTALVYANATGLGEPIMQILRREELELVAVYFNHGDRRFKESESEVRLGKAYLVARLKALFQTAQIHLPRTREAMELARDLQDYEVHVTEDANERYGSFPVGRHDDLITALGLSVQVEPDWPSPPFQLLIG